MKEQTRMSKSLFIIHFLPIELYPPVLNFTQVISDDLSPKSNLEVFLLTTKPENNLDPYSCSNVNILRYRGIELGMSYPRRLLQYFYIYLNFLIQLLTKRPKVVMYYGTFSSLPIFIYSILYKSVKVYIHYHELFTLEQLKTGRGRMLHRILNKLENKQLYSKARWISETNMYRLKIFLSQYNINYNPDNHKVLPNYPPKEWIERSLFKPKHDLIKLVHIGSLSMEGMYIAEVLSAFGNNKKYEIYFYSHSTNEIIIQKLKSYKNVHFMGSINYDELIQLKGLYDVGLVLYKTKSLNFTYNAPNKIFEYLALDLDVWCSDKLVTAKDYVISNTYPKMLMVDFENLATLNISDALNKEGLEYKNSPYFCETVYKPLSLQIYEDINT
ncbi:hypothetical protein EHW67_16045 [Arenibacter aquaticus]|uniref:Glycosyltransferase subfamily 4-like N-terminal domain-containing protein n=1 Tax=Arenibacter aquaticus TaxID=2489054 RepID=A0A430JY36_9FLAO|nr:hypothetical protein [Arenibacter aquaticus]RTE51722.1 hypothetical protein EHW67_16045 [Arenibacter aquaticus]